MHDVDSVLDELYARDETTGRQVMAAWRLLSKGRSDYTPSQRDVQEYLWLVLPGLVRAGDGVPDRYQIADALAQFFDLLGQPRYALLCRDERTAEILAAAHDERRCAELVAAAMRDSGVLPPDDLELVWRDDPGPTEAAAYDMICRSLEHAIADGTIELGTRDTEAARIKLATLALNTEPVGEKRTLLQLVLLERLEQWARGQPSQTMRELVVRNAPDVAKPIELEPRELAEGLRPLRLLLDECGGDGAKLTGAGYLPTGLVARLVDCMPACDRWVASGPSESHWLPVTQLRELAARCGLVRKYRGRLKLTKLGARVADHDRRLLTLVGYRIPQTVEPAARQVMDATYTTLLLERMVHTEVLDARIAAVLHESGWRQDEHERVSRSAVTLLRGNVLGDVDVLGGIDEKGTFGPVGLTPMGRMVVLAVLRSRIMRGVPLE